MSDHVKLITEVYRAFEQRDVATLLEWLHPQVEMVQTALLPWGGQYQGHQGFIAFFGKLLSHINSRVEPQEFIEAGDNIVVTGRVSGTVNANGNAFDLRVVHVWTIQDGKARRFEAYIDTPAMLKALELDD
jgi:ketosteroid isomerase-like protein